MEDIRERREDKDRRDLHDTRNVVRVNGEKSKEFWTNKVVRQG